MSLQVIPRRRPVRLLLGCAALAAAGALGACNMEDIQISEKHLQPIPAETVAVMERRGMTKEAPILIRVFKEESELELWKKDNTGQFALLKTYPICRWSGELGPKVKQGDRQAPEGFYTIHPAQMNPNSQYYLSFNMGYPERLRPRPWAHGRAPDGAWQLLLGRLLFDDRRADRRDFRDRPRRLLRRPEIVPGAGLSVPDDGAEHGEAPRQPASCVLEDAQAGQRSFRGDAPAAESRRVREALRVQCRRAGEHVDPAEVRSGRPLPGL